MLKILNLSKQYNENNNIVLKDYSFENSKSYCILGPSGSGKSTLLNMLAGTIIPSSGVIMINDEFDLVNLSEKEKTDFRSNKVGYISQDFKLFDSFTVFDNLNILSIQGNIYNDIKDVLSWVGLEHKCKAKVKNLSGGEKQRVAIARALLKKPEFMFCDEPTGSLPYNTGRDIMKLIIDLHHKDKNLLLVVTHDDRMIDLFDEVIKFDDLIRNK